MIGKRVGSYEITAKLGEGGMGEVYRATDTKLKRDVAIKVLPQGFTEDNERLARFEREAQLLAQLNHPNIAAIYALEKWGQLPISGAGANESHAEGKSETVPIFGLVLELVEGPTLAERLEQGPLPFNESLSISLQIAQALEEAHEKGIVHRDLKPQNIKASIEGKVKVLDFGLAKALDPTSAGSGPGSAAQMAQSPTLTLGGTQMGVILGTAAYMAPEQAKGLAVDKRADIWAFGVVLYEMLTGRSLFAGDSVPDTLARVLQREIDFGALPASTPPAIGRLLRRCLERNPKNRLHDIADARIVLDEVSTGRFTEASPAAEQSATGAFAPSRVALAVGAALLLALGAVAGRLSRGAAPPASETTTRLSIRLPSSLPYRVNSVPGSAIAISRDGASVAYVAAEAERGELVVRALSDSAPRSIATDGVQARQPFFSPDGSWIGFFSDDSLRKISLEGGRSVLLASGIPNALWVRGSWSDDGRIVFDTWNAGLRVVSADGGAVRVLTEPKEEWHLGPEMIPGTETVLFFTQSAASFRVEAIELDGTGRRTVLDDASQPRVLASGHLLFQRDRGLFVAPFDARTARVTGAALPVDLETMDDDVRVASPIPQLAVSANGTLVYAPKQPAAAPASELAWVDRQGRSEPLAAVPFPLPSFDLSPDGGQLALAGRFGNRARLALLDLPRNSLTPLRDERLDIATGPVFSADGREIYFARYDTHGGEVLAQSIEGGEPRVLGRLEGTWIAPFSASADGRWLVGSFYDPETESDLWVVDLQASDPANAARSLAVAGAQVGPAISPDGRWLADFTTETGAPEVFLRRFPGGESKVRVSSGGGVAPRWSRDGRELFYQSEDGSSVMAVSVATEPKLVLGTPRKLFGGAFWAGWDAGPSFAVSPDGQRFLMMRRVANEKQSDELIVVQNWFAELERLVSPNAR